MRVDIFGVFRSCAGALGCTPVFCMLIAEQTWVEGCTQLQTFAVCAACGECMRVHCDRASCLAGKDAAGFSQPYFCLHGVTGRGWFFTALFLSAWAGFSQPYFCPALLEKDAAGFLTAQFLSALLEKDATGFSQPC